MANQVGKPLPMRKLLLKRNDLKIINNTDALKSVLYKEEEIYKSTKGDFLNLDTSCTIFNKLNLLTKNSVTLVNFDNSPLVRTSENLSALIGQNNYNTVISTLLSVINHEQRIRAIFALLTVPKKSRTVSCQTEESLNCVKEKEKDKTVCLEKECQTEESSIIQFSNETKKRVKRRQATPYVVTETVKKAKKVVVNPGPFLHFSKPSPNDLSSSESNLLSDSLCNESLPILTNLNEHLDESSNDSSSRMSTFTVNTIPGLENDPLGIVENVNKVTAAPSDHRTQQTLDWSNCTQLTLLDGTKLRIPVKIEDDFHVATPEILSLVSPEHRKKLLYYQMYLDWKHCLTPDDENHLPLHTAAINGDHDLVRRQCSMLKSRGKSVDIPTEDGMTALQISIYRNHPLCTKTLLYFGADPLTTDEEYRTCFHLAAEADPAHLKGMVQICHLYPMRILNDELWKPELESKPKEYLTKYLLRTISVMTDNQGYTPLMLAAILGKFENVKTLAEASPEAVDTQMPNSGNTALLLAVGAASLLASKGGYKSAVFEEFKKIIGLLVELGANPSLENHAGSNVNTVLQDLHVSELSVIIANKMTLRNCLDIELKGAKPCVLLKDEDGNIACETLKEVKQEIVKSGTDVKNEKDSKNDKVQIEISLKDAIPIDETHTKEKPNIIRTIKVEMPSPSKQGVSSVACADTVAIIEQNLPKKGQKCFTEKAFVNSKGDYLATFWNFVSDVKNAKIASPIPVVETSKVDDSQNANGECSNSSTKTILIAKTAKGSNSKIIEEAMYEIKKQVERKDCAAIVIKQSKRPLDRHKPSMDDEKDVNVKPKRKRSRDANAENRGKYIMKYKSNIPTSSK